MAIFRADVLHAACRIMLDGTAFLINRGFSALVDTGAGDRLLTFDQQIDALERIVLSSVTTATNGFAITVQTSDSQMQVLTFNVAGAATDLQSDHLVLRVGPM